MHYSIILNVARQKCPMPLQSDKHKLIFIFFSLQRVKPPFFNFFFFLIRLLFIAYKKCIMDLCERIPHRALMQQRAINGTALLH